MQDDRLVRVLKALADPKRFRMVREIAKAGELNCGQVGEMFPLSQPTISHHLKLLCEAGILTVRQEGQNHFISVDRKLLKEVVGALPLRLSAPRRRSASARAGRA
jgi:ArsR family transcriptional regulator